MFMVLFIYFITAISSFYFGMSYGINQTSDINAFWQDEWDSQHAENVKLKQQIEDLKQSITGEITAVEIEVNDD